MANRFNYTPSGKVNTIQHIPTYLHDFPVFIDNLLLTRYTFFGDHMLIPFDELKQHSFSLSDIKVILQNPPYVELRVKERCCNGFIYIRSGSCRYAFDGGEFLLSDGSVAYLPFGSRHRLTILSGSAVFYRVDFTLHIDGELALFSDHPIKLTDQASPECIQAIAALEADYGIGENTIIKTEKLCTILSSLQKNTMSAARKRLMPAVIHLQDHASDNINCTSLAGLCFLSTSRFYDLFRAEFGVTPLQYRDLLLISRAKAMLSAGDITVREVAFATGFEKDAYFSRFFKKHVGIPPSEYIKVTCHTKQ